MSDMSDMPVIFSYTEDNAIADGVLFHPYPKRWPWLLISVNVNAACSNNDSGRTYDQCLVPLCMDAILAAQAEQAKAMKGKKVSLPLVLENTIAGTVWISPNSKGGITICQPEEN